ncbi:MAG: MtrB/PioB family decaheme-associated outer membrane protein [Elusimicrobia bacterium]|nr:MtrB/PioB family decaheme-associated outer membrane protein [Elusimicrobiota bacterium]
MSLSLAAVAGAQTSGTGSLDLKGGFNAVTAGSEEKFQEYRQLSDGFLFYDLRYMEDLSSPYFLDLKLKGGAGANDSYSARGGEYGKWDLGVSYDRLTHNFNKGTLLLSGAGENRLTINGSVQTSLQAVEQTRQERGSVALTDTTGEDAQAQAIVRNLLAGTDPTTFKLERRSAALALNHNLTPEVKTWVNVKNEWREGARLISAGAYERYFQPFPATTGLGHTGDQFVVSGTELAEPLDFRTKTFKAGAGVYKKTWLADLEYTLTDFNNENQSLIWANPYRSTYAIAQSSYGTNANTYDRARFANGQMALAPSNRTHDLSASGSVELPCNTRFTGNVSYGLTTQNTALLPYTLNTAMAGVGGAPANVTDVAALPVSRFGGEVKTITQSFALTTRFTDALGASLKYRYYDYANNSDSILFPGYAAFGESYWRTVRNDNNAPVRNDTASYTRKTTKLGVDYELSHPLSVDAEAFTDSYDHKEQRVAATNESGAGAGFTYKPGRSYSVKGAYKYAHRTVSGYKTGATAANPEAPGLANFNWAERNRNRADLRADVSLNSRLSLGAAGQYQKDTYGVGNRFGFKSQKNLIGSLDAVYEPSENISLTASYSRENRKGRTDNGAKDDKFNAAGTLDDAYTGDSFNPYNYWRTDITEDVDTVGLDALLSVVPEKVDVNLGYSYSDSRMKYDNSNQNGTVKLANAEAIAWPTVVNRLHELRAGCAYKVKKDLKVGLNYLFAWYKNKDFANTGAYLAGLTPENTTKFVMTGATRASYEAHALSAYMAYKF